MNKIELYKEKTFDQIKHIDKYGKEYWEARELQKILEYKEWRKFENVIKKRKQHARTVISILLTILSASTKWFLLVQGLIENYRIINMLVI